LISSFLTQRANNFEDLKDGLISQLKLTEPAHVLPIVLAESVPELHEILVAHNLVPKTTATKILRDLVLAHGSRGVPFLLRAAPDLPLVNGHPGERP